ncbi:DNA modification methylase [Candidatus Poribacteria bacterium]|nr:DNA modification methylase [Candidatus Poribacteria bacterium]
MKFDDLKDMYSETQLIEGEEAYKAVSQLLQDAKERHKQDFLRDRPDGDHEQSWRAFKGKNFEKLIQHIITESIEALGLKVINGNQLERTIRLPNDLRQVKKNLLIDFGEFGCHLPDVDIIVYNPENLRVIALISSKVTLRERIAQTGYWKLKLLEQEDTEHIKVYFITPDEDGTLTSTYLPKKGRAIVEIDLDGTYVLTEANLEESDKVKLFEHFIQDFKQLLVVLQY